MPTFFLIYSFLDETRLGPTCLPLRGILIFLLRELWIKWWYYLSILWPRRPHLVWVVGGPRFSGSCHALLGGAGEKTKIKALKSFKRRYILFFFFAMLILKFASFRMTLSTYQNWTILISEIQRRYLPRSNIRHLMLEGLCLKAWQIPDKHGLYISYSDWDRIRRPKCLVGQCFCKGYNDWSPYVLVSANSRGHLHNGEALSVQGRSKVKTCIFFFAFNRSPA